MTARGFPRLGHDCLALRVTDGEKERRIFIHAHDFFSSGLWPETDPHDQIERILLDDGYRESLERNARSYYEEHLTPAAMMRRLLPLARAGP